MRMKEVCEKTGLTDRAVRLYIENGLLSPEQESNYAGRKSIRFSEEDVEILNAIAILRKAEFSLADIRQMQKEPGQIPDILSAHREELIRDIAQKQKIVRVLEMLRPEEQTDYTGVAEWIRCSAAPNHLPKEENGMNLHDLHAMIRRRIPALTALLLMVIGAVCYFPMVIRAVFMENMSVQPNGGGYSLDMAFSWEAMMTCWPLVLAGLLYVGAIALLFLYVIKGNKPLQYTAAGLCIMIAVLLMLLPGEIRDKLFLHEFLQYRYSFMHEVLYSASEGFDRFIRSLKFVPPLISAALSIIGAMIDRNSE